MADRMTTREAIAIVRDEARHCGETVKTALLTVAAVAEHNHARRTRRKSDRRERKVATAKEAGE